MISKKKIAAIIATTAAVAFVAAPLTANAHGKVKCYGVSSCKNKQSTCKDKGYKMMSTKACKKAGGSTEAPATTTTTEKTTSTTAPATTEPAATDNSGSAN